MIKSSHFARWLSCICAAMLCAVVVAMPPVNAQQPAAAEAAARTNPAVATDGATLIHGNYCGAGNRPGKPPIDALDLACMNHDACTPTGGIPTCDCNVRLRDEAASVAADPRQAPELRSLASLTAAAATVMFCKPIIDATTPAAPEAAPPVARAPVDRAPVAGAPISIVPAAAVPAQETPAPATSASTAPLPETVVQPAAPLSVAPQAAPEQSDPEQLAPVSGATGGEGAIAALTRAIALCRRA